MSYESIAYLHEKNVWLVSNKGIVHSGKMKQIFRNNGNKVEGRMRFFPDDCKITKRFKVVHVGEYPIKSILNTGETFLRCEGYYVQPTAVEANRALGMVPNSGYIDIDEHEMIYEDKDDESCALFDEKSSAQMFLAHIKDIIMNEVNEEADKLQKEYFKKIDEIAELELKMNTFINETR